MLRYSFLTLRHQLNQSIGLAAIIVVGMVGQSRMADPSFEANFKAPRSSVTATAMARRPEAMALSADRQSLWVVCRDGSIICHDVSESRFVGSWHVGGELTDVVFDQSDRMIVLDEEANLLRVFEFATDHQPTQVDSVDLISVGSSLRALGNNRIAVLSQWNRDITFMQRTSRGSSQQDKTNGDTRSNGFEPVVTISIPFAPGDLIALDDPNHFLVSDAFGGRLALVDQQSAETRLMDDSLGHNIRGLARSSDGRRIHVAQQLLNQMAPITPNGIEFGDVLKHVVRTIEVESIQEAEDHWAKHAETYELGFAGIAATDPEDLVVLEDGQWLVPLGGVNQLAIVDPAIFRETRVDVAKRPIEVLVDESRMLAFVLCQFGEVVEVIDIQTAQRLEPLALGAISERSVAELGEELFFDATLSRDQWLSCHSCHTDGHTNGLLADTMGDGTHGTPKRVLSLRGVAHTGPWAWNGSVDELHRQVSKSVTSTMHGSELQSHENEAIAAFLRTLPAPPPAIHPDTSELQDRIGNGESLFGELGCVECHAPESAFTTEARFDVGIYDELGAAEFNPPSLHGVGHRMLLFHDGRSKSLEEAFGDVQHQLTRELTPRELADLVAYLKSR